MNGEVLDVVLSHDFLSPFFDQAGMPGEKIRRILVSFCVHNGEKLYPCSRKFQRSILAGGLDLALP